MEGHPEWKVLTHLTPYHSEDIKSVKPIINGWFTFFTKKPWSSFLLVAMCIKMSPYIYILINDKVYKRKYFGNTWNQQQKRREHFYRLDHAVGLGHVRVLLQPFFGGNPTDGYLKILNNNGNPTPKASISLTYFFQVARTCTYIGVYIIYIYMCVCHMS